MFLFTSTHYFVGYCRILWFVDLFYLFLFCQLCFLAFSSHMLPTFAWFFMFLPLFLVHIVQFKFNCLYGYSPSSHSKKYTIIPSQAFRFYIVSEAGLLLKCFYLSFGFSSCWNLAAIFKCDVLSTNVKVGIVKHIFNFMIIHIRLFQRNIKSFPHSAFAFTKTSSAKLVCC